MSNGCPVNLNDYIHNILLDGRARGRGYFKPRAVARMLDTNSNGLIYSKEIFLLVALELWHRCFVDHYPSDMN